MASKEENSELKSRIIKVINDFYIEERGNKVTSNNIRGLLEKFGDIFNIDEKEDKKGG